MDRMLLIAYFFFALGCGVRGNPLPPIDSAELGRGKPSYRGATEDIVFPQRPSIESADQSDMKDKDGKSNKDSKDGRP